MKYRIIKVSKSKMDYFYEVHRYENNQWTDCGWLLECSFNTLSAAESYIQSQAQPTRTLIKEYNL